MSDNKQQKNQVLDLDVENDDLENNIRLRQYKGYLSYLVIFLATTMAVFHLYTGAFGAFTGMVQRGVHLMFVLCLVYLLYPATRKSSTTKLPYYDAVLSVLGFVVGAYVVVFYDDIIAREGAITDIEVVLGVIAVLLILEATRRTLGMGLVILVSIFLVYAYVGPYMPGVFEHRGYSTERIANQLYLTTSGIFSIPFGTSATIIALFILFGALLDRSGAGKNFMDIAFILAGRLSGGPAKASVIGSALMGTVTGSAVANVVTTGTFTIPLMKKNGYSSRFAGATEAVASTGGQVMPPVMGAAAFIMAEYTTIPYLEICIAALLPAILYYVSLLGMVHFEAVKTGLKGMPSEMIPSFKKTIAEGFHLLIPLALLIILLVMGYSPMYAVFRCMVLLFIACMIKKATRMNFRSIIAIFEQSAKGILGVATACATAGIIIGVLTITGMATKFSSLLIDVSGGNFFALLLLTALASIILGMGLPTAACYVLLAALVAPALVDSGMSVLAAHLFILYYGCLSAITPPVALAAYAGAGIAGSNPFKTGFTACRIGIVAFIVPFMFAYGPELLLTEGFSLKTLIVACTSTLGCIAIACGMIGYMIRPCSVIERILLIIASINLIYSTHTTDLIGISSFAAVFVWQWINRNKPVNKKEEDLSSQN